MSLRMNLLISLGICSTPKLSVRSEELGPVVYFALTNKATQCVPVFSY